MTTDKSVVAQPDSKSSLDEPTPSFVKLAMRNMVKKGGTSLYHFFLSAVALLSLFVGLAYLTR
ncbi:MAG: DUF3285 domain-containing protein [Leptolyngbya foveolarum]|uniref:DUF3285 domain-containing protein n=1 Tax=Leptolyngbya foveolarum TaxID=47253 RepID=A0A2W4WE19_9CYAN|nr:MAG: DUF3285 domain-containing protein [Leptolyngbya foveolarum]